MFVGDNLVISVHGYHDPLIRAVGLSQREQSPVVCRHHVENRNVASCLSRPIASHQPVGKRTNIRLTLRVLVIRGSLHRIWGQTNIFPLLKFGCLRKDQWIWFVPFSLAGF
jgi:hypothetical protein